MTPLRIAFLHNDEPRERLLADAFLRGAARHGHEVAAIAKALAPDPGRFDVIGMVGVKSRELFRTHQHAGTHVVYFDKGYCRQRSPNGLRTWEYWRVAIDAHQPTDRLMKREMPGDRLERLDIELRPWRTTGDCIVYAGSSAKYHDFYGLREPTTYGAKIVRHIRSLSKRPIVYRPKPSWKEAVPIEGTRWSGREEKIGELMSHAWVMVTHGSNACFEAVLWGVPTIILGNGVARPLSSTVLEDIERPRLASDEERLSWLKALAWWQWTTAEFASGEAFEFLEGELHG